jgi:hypothetical protein
MSYSTVYSRSWATTAIARRAALIAAAGAAGTALLSGPQANRAIAAQANASRPALGADLKPIDAIQCAIAAMRRFPLVAIGERHLMQEMHDFLTRLLLRPELPGLIDDIVVEFGNALYQDLADRFILGDKPVATTDLQQLWRFTIGGDILWDAPIYERFFRTVRAINWALPPSKRIRVLLGDPPFDHRKVRGVADKSYVQSAQVGRDAHYAAVVEREVLQKHRRALLIAGSNHLLRGIHSGDNPHVPNAVGVLEQRYPGATYVMDLLVLPPGTQSDPLVKRTLTNVAGWPRPAAATLAHTWLGETTQSVEPWVNSAAYLAITPGAVRFGSQADAVLYLGPGEVLTASQADAAMYEWGPYAAELRRLSRIVTQIFGSPTDLVAEGLTRAQAAPSWFAQYPGK